MTNNYYQKYKERFQTELRKKGKNSPKKISKLYWKRNRKKKRQNNFLRVLTFFTLKSFFANFMINKTITNTFNSDKSYCLY